MTSAPMMECKKVLGEVADTGCEESELIGLAVDLLRKQGKLQSQKKAGRTAAEGLIGTRTLNDGTAAVMGELNCETDFVSRNDAFQKALASTLDAGSGLVTGSGDIDLTSVMGAGCEGGESVEQVFEGVVLALREKLELRRMASLQAEEGGIVVPYVHNQAQLNFKSSVSLGRIGALVAISPLSPGSPSKDELQALGRSIAMHTAATTPLYLSSAHADKAAVDKEATILREQARMSGKPAAVVEKIVQGRLQKFYSETCLVDMPFVLGDGQKQTVGMLLQEHKAKVTGFLRWQVGEGVETDVTLSLIHI